MRVMFALMVALLLWPLSLSSRQDGNTLVRDGTTVVTSAELAIRPTAQEPLWLTVACAAVESASPFGCRYLYPPPRVTFYDYPETSELCTAETPADIGVRCVPFSTFKAWLIQHTDGRVR